MYRERDMYIYIYICISIYIYIYINMYIYSIIHPITIYVLPLWCAVCGCQYPFAVDERCPTEGP